MLSRQEELQSGPFTCRSLGLASASVAAVDIERALELLV